MMEDLSEVLKQYPITVKKCRLLSWKGKKAVWSIRTNNGLKILKKSPSAKGRLQYLCKAVRHLRRNGAPVPALVSTRNGADFSECRGNCYILSDAVEGRQPEYDSPEELAQIMRTLGRFHLSSRGFTGRSDDRQRMHLGQWEQAYKEQLQDLTSFRKQARRRPSPFSRLYLQHVDTLVRQGKDALRMIQGRAYLRWVAKVKRQGNLCHQDFASGNLILGAKGLHVIDMDSLTLDLPARDLRKIINKVMKKGRWTTDKIAAMLRAYHSVHPLTDEEYNVLKADLLFPHLFYGISSKYYLGRMEAGWSDRKALAKLSSMIQSETSKINVIQRWDQVIQQSMT